MSYSIPFNRPCLAGNEYRYIAEAIANGHASGDGPFTKKCHQLLERELGTMKALLTTSCTHALEMAALLLDCGPDDEVIVPSYTFVSTANAFALRGARIVFCDIRPDTLNLNEELLESLITPRTKVIAPVHYAGVPCAMDRIMEIARRHGIHVVEDNAHGLFARFRANIQARLDAWPHRVSMRPRISPVVRAGLCWSMTRSSWNGQSLFATKERTAVNFSVAWWTSTRGPI